jgi:hypothetical protein
MRELPRFPGKLRVAKALLGNLEGPGTEEALCPPSQVECHLVKTIRAGVGARTHTDLRAIAKFTHRLEIVLEDVSRNPITLAPSKRALCV